MNRKEESLQSRICKYLKKHHPNVIWHVDHGSAKRRGYAEGNILKVQQYKPGYPDCQILKSSKHYHGLFLELKKDWQELHYTNGLFKKGEEDHFVHQYEFHKDLTANGYYACFVWDYDMAVLIIQNYCADRLIDIQEVKFGKPTLQELADVAADRFFEDYF